MSETILVPFICMYLIVFYACTSKHISFCLSLYFRILDETYEHKKNYEYLLYLLHIYISTYNKVSKRVHCGEWYVHSKTKEINLCCIVRITDFNMFGINE